MKIGIIGGGAAGISASIAAIKGCKKVVICERTASLLNKFILSGGGRCNISNQNLSPDHYNGGSRHFIANVLKSFGNDKILSLLREIGSKYKIEPDGRIYTGDSKETAYKLIRYTAALGTEIRYKAFVEKIERKDSGFEVLYKGQYEFFDKIIISTGGKSYPETGSDGYGYALAESLGHTIIHPLPALTSLDLKPNPFSGLQGITLDVKISLENKRLDIFETERGQIIFTHRGISGPVAHNISGRYIRISREKGTQVYINFIPEFTKDTIGQRIQEEINRAGKKKVVNFLSRYLPDRFALRIVSLANIPDNRILAELKRSERLKLLECLTEFKVNISGSPGFKLAHVTSGGVSLDEVHFSTMESKIVKGLFFAGEILDVDGIEGGYNLHWAFATGYLAGKSASTSK